MLDCAALDQLARSRGPQRSRPGRVHAALRGALNADAQVIVPAAVLAELYRGSTHDQAVDACLGRNGQIAVADTTRQLARQIGHLLAHANCDSAHHVDAAVVATALASGGGLILTGDPGDLKALAAGQPRIRVEGL